MAHRLVPLTMHTYGVVPLELTLTPVLITDSSEWRTVRNINSNWRRVRNSVKVLDSCVSNMQVILGHWDTTKGAVVNKEYPRGGNQGRLIISETFMQVFFCLYNTPYRNCG